MNRHLVAVKVRVKSRTHKRMNLNGVSFNKHRLKSLNSETMQSRRSVYEHVFALNNFFQNRPNIRSCVVNQAVCSSDIVRKSAFNQFIYYKRPEKLQSHELRKPALV